MDRVSHPTSGDALPLSLSPGYVVLSFLVSLVGCTAAVELLHRRSNTKGWTKWIQLVSCSTAFGLVGVWCMSSVANSATLLADGSPNLSIFYHPEFVVLSAVVPMTTAFVAFVAADRRYRGKASHILSLLVCGSMCGLSVVATHYISAVGASNYQLSFRSPFATGAVLIACVACTVVVFLVFKLQDKWLASWKWRLLCASTLAGATTGMHYEALVGTVYTFKHVDDRASQQRHGMLTVGLTLSLLSAIGNILLFAHTLRRHKQISDRAQQVVLACARFDHEGRIMVTREGMLPCRKITTHDNQRSFDDEFNVSHAVFQWIFRVSNDWSSIVPWLPGIRDHLRAIDAAEKSGRTSSGSDALSVWLLRPSDEKYSVIFGESFCVAAADLAADLKEPLHELGKLFDGVMTSGTQSSFGISKRPRRWWRLMRSRSAMGDVEAGTFNLDIFGQGQVLFVAKRTEKKDVPKFQCMGYRFMPMAKVAPLLAELMRVPRGYLDEHLARVKALALDRDAYKKQPAGVFLACFALRPGMGGHSWDIMVNKDQLHKLPYVPLWSLEKMSERQRFLDRLEGQEVATCLCYLAERANSLDEEEQAFAKAFKRAIMALGELVAEPFFRNAALSSRITKAPTIDHTGKRSYCKLVAFHVLPDIHGAGLHSLSKFTYTPLSFFKCRQQTLDRAASDRSFQQRVDKEFAARFAGGRIDHAQGAEDSSTPSSPTTSRRLSSLGVSSKWMFSSGTSQRGLRPNSVLGSATSTDMDYESSSKSLACRTAISESEKHDSAALEARGAGGEERSESRAAPPERPVDGLSQQRTFVDELFAVATAKWIKR